MKPDRPSGEPLSQRQLAEEFGISRARQWRMKHVADIPYAEFEAMIESDDPPTISALVNYARTGTTKPDAKLRLCPHCGGVI